MDNYKVLVRQWGLVMILFIVIALTCIGLILSPMETHIRVDMWQADQGQELIYAPSALTVEGIKARAEAWRVSPGYNAGLGFVAVLSLLGAFHACRVMYALRDVEEKKEIGE